ncbi:hypothetical protein ACHAWF_010723 [Thalassiosira exigua]
MASVRRRSSASARGLSPRQTTIAPSRKRVRTILSTVIALLVPCYVFLLFRISELERIHSTSQGGNGGSLNALATPRLRQSSGLGQGCASTLLYYYVSASLLWIVVLRRKRNRRLGGLINVASAWVFLAFWPSGDGHCKTLVDRGTCAIIDTMINEGASYHSYSPDKGMDVGVRISFRLGGHAPSHVKFCGVPGYRCGDQADLPPSLSGPTVLNFTTTISTNLKLVFIGDSISEQLAESFDSTVLGDGFERNRMAQTYRNGRGNINLHQCVSVASPIRGGGVSAFWRIATLMSASTKEYPYLCEHRWRTWNERPALALLDHRYSDDGKSFDHRYFHPKINETGTKDLPYSVAAFDVVILRVPHGWLKIKEITRERIIEAINLSNIYLGARTVIIATLPLNNNVLTPSDWDGVAKINQMIRDVAHDWKPPNGHPGEVQWVLVQEFGNFTNQIVWMNAKHVGLTNSSTPDFSKGGWELAGVDFLLKRLSAEPFWSPSIAMVCAEPTYPTVNEKNEKVEDCIRSKISRDGIHWCVETLGPRYSASIACLLGCVHNGKEPTTDRRHRDMVMQCERKCNDQFMSILPIKEEWSDGRISLFSKAIPL